MTDGRMPPLDFALPQTDTARRWLLADVPPVRASVVIVNYNAGDKLRRCLASILSSARGDYEIIVVDNASSDGIADRILVEFPDVRLIRSDTNLGFGGGNNLGARYAGGRFLVFLNPDTEADSGWLEALIAPLQADARVGLTTPKILLLNQPDRINTCGNAIHLTGLTLCRGMRQSREAFARIEEVDAVSGAAFAIRRDVFEALGGFDEDFFLYMEDTDLSWRARLAGYGCLYVPASVVYHDYTLRITSRKVFYQERNRYLILLKSLAWPSLLMLLPALLLAEALTWGFVLLGDRANLGNKLSAYRWIAANWRRILRKRAQTQTLRRVPDRELLRRAGYRLDFGQTATSLVATLAHSVFDPLFAAIKAVMMLVV